MLFAGRANQWIPGARCPKGCSEGHEPSSSILGGTARRCSPRLLGRGRGWPLVSCGKVWMRRVLLKSRSRPSTIGSASAVTGGFRRRSILDGSDPVSRQRAGRRVGRVGRDRVAPGRRRRGWAWDGGQFDGGEPQLQLPSTSAGNSCQVSARGLSDSAATPARPHLAAGRRLHSTVDARPERLAHVERQRTTQLGTLRPRRRLRHHALGLDHPRHPLPTPLSRTDRNTPEWPTPMSSRAEHSCERTAHRTSCACT